jgi:uncharacterized protein (UPF0332 family)
MTLSSADKAALSDIRMKKASEFLDDAASNLADSRFKTSVNRSYYASLGAVRALLILEGIDPESHAGAVTTLSLHFVKTKLLRVEIVRDFKTLQSRRFDVDYGDFDTIELEDAEDSLKLARKILEEVETVRKKLLAEL